MSVRFTGRIYPSGGVRMSGGLSPDAWFGWSGAFVSLNVPQPTSAENFVA